MNNNSKYQVNSSTGSLFRKMIQISLPLVFTGILQLLYNATDMIVVGRFAGATALSAVGSAGNIVNLTVNFFMGLAVGSGIIISSYYGGEDYDGMKETLHTSILVAIISGIFITFLGLFITKPLLELMRTPSDVIEEATLYLQIFFIGTPFTLIYNFGASILRGIGDAKRPLHFLLISGALNVALNLLFVVTFKMGVAGVASATIISQLVSAILVINCFLKNDDYLKLELKHLKLNKLQLNKIFRIGIPAGIQGSLFTVSNTLVQSSINLFGSSVMAANAASSNIENFLNTSVSGIQQATTVIAGQNMGARQYKRVRQCLYYSVLMTIFLSGTLAFLMYITSTSLISLYNDDLYIIELGVTRLKFMVGFYVIAGLMNVMGSHIRGMGYSIGPTIITLCSVCVFRFFWIAFVFPKFEFLETIYVVYPITWTLAVIGNLIFYLRVSKKLPNLDEQTN